MTACQNQSPIPTTDFEDEKLVVNGMITDSLQTQIIKVGLVGNLGDTSSVPIDINDFSLSVSQGSSTYPFYAINGNTYHSTTPFKGMTDSTYQLSFCYKGECVTKEFSIPANIDISNPTVIHSFSAQSGRDEIHLTINSPKPQFIHYELYGNYNEELFDSTWIYLRQPIYNTTQVQAGTSTYYINQFSSFHQYITGFKALRIEIYAMTSQSVEFLNKLAYFMESNFTGSQYQNPPTYYDAEVYGMVYGTSVDTILYIF